MLLTSALTLSGCEEKTEDYSNIDYKQTITNYDSNNLENDNNDLVSKFNENYFNINKLDYALTDNEINLLSNIISMNDEDVSNLEYVISNIKVNYPHEDLLNTDIILNKYNDLNIDLSVEQNILTDIDIYNIVKENNNNYDNSKYTKINDTKLKEICKIIYSTFNYVLNRQDDTKKNELIYKFNNNINNLKIFEGENWSNADITDELCLVINFDLIDSRKNETNIIVNFEEIISHETIHIIQRLPVDILKNSNLKTSYGPSYQYINNDFNCLYNKWFVEASAEIIAMENHNLDTNIYDVPVTYLDTLYFVTRLSDNQITADNFLYKDLNEIYKCFKPLDNSEIIKMLYYINIVTDFEEEFFESYETSIGNLTSVTDKRIIKDKSEIAISKSLTKIYYYNLINKVKKDNINLQELFESISIFENTLNKILRYADSSNININNDFLNEYTMLQEELFNIISKNMNISRDNIFYLYNCYNFSNIPNSYGIYNENLNKYVDNIIQNKDIPINLVNKCYMDSEIIDNHNK